MVLTIDEIIETVPESVLAEAERVDVPIILGKLFWKKVNVNVPVGKIEGGAV